MSTFPQPQLAPLDAAATPGLAPGQLGLGENSPQQKPADPLEGNLLLQKSLWDLVIDLERDDEQARRQEVRDILERRLYFRGDQYWWYSDRNNTWYPPTVRPSDGDDQDLPAFQHVTNIIQPFTLSAMAVLSQNNIRARFWPVSARDPKDVATAKSASKVVDFIHRNNDDLNLRDDATYYSCMDGFIGSYTRYVSDGEKYGYDEQEQLEPQQVGIGGGEAVTCSQCGYYEQGGLDITPVCPDCGSAMVPVAPESAQVNLPNGQMDQIPKGQEVITIIPALQLKRSMWADEQKDFLYLTWVTDLHKAKAQSVYSSVAEKIDKSSDGGSSSGEMQERQARRLLYSGSGYNPGVVTKDLGTFRRIWLRPCAFNKLSFGNPSKDELKSLFPRGCYVVFYNDVYCESREESMDDHWETMQSLPGEGQIRETPISSIMPVQDQLNDCSNMLFEQAMFGTPEKIIDQNLFDKEARNQQVTLPGQETFVNLGPNQDIRERVYYSDPVEPSAAMQTYREQLFTEVPQFLTGVLPALFGGDLGGNDLMDVDELIPTPSGFVRNGDLRDNDTVFGQDGKPYQIAKAHPHKTKQAFKVTFDDGTFTYVHDGHLWTTFNLKERITLLRRTDAWREARRNSRASRATGSRGSLVTQLVTERNHANHPETILPSQGTVRRTDEILRTLRTKTGATNHAVHITAPVELPHRDLVLDPYCLGAWLGDGGSHGGHFTGAEKDALPILFYFDEAGFSFKKTPSKTDKHAWYIRGITTKLRTIGVLKNKHIPQEYLWASAEQRLALLQGLMDTDGCATTNGHCVFVNTNGDIAEGVYQVAASLGLKPSVAIQMSVPIYNKKYRRWYGGNVPTYRVTWTSSLPVFRLERKLARLKKVTRKTQEWRYIVNVELAGERTMRCLTTTNPTGLYLFGRNFNVTHNTKGGIQIQRNQALGRMGRLWRRLQIFWANTDAKAVKCFAANRTEDIEVAILGDGGDYQTEWLSLDDVQGNVIAYPEVDQSFPVTEMEIADRITNLLMQGSEYLTVQLSDPENVDYVNQRIGLGELQAPGEAQRKKTNKIITRMEQEEPIEGPGWILLPSIQPDPVVDNLVICLDTAKRWLVSDAGIAAETNNPMWYGNVRAYANACDQLQKMQEIQQAVTQASVPGAATQPEVPGQDGDAKGSDAASSSSESGSGENPQFASSALTDGGE